ncbi:hypothetical protein [Algoriphagus antarcticus]|uniref:Uncharacterized protein n=1 Tax=Algoriphagus antarcticus TaxID=238540 RepID=A0A3E0EB47_9BACT|nr:hypothetical protein [Algoriphagus antarcticus]REG94469.1 hypothetical protein C8N25_101296 [Algoriphagus antarcticus]
MSKKIDTIITLYVDTQKIFKFSNSKADKPEILNHILLCDNHYDHPSEAEFTSNIHPKTKIAWVGAAMHIRQSEEDFVIIKKIKPQKGKSILKIYDSKLSSGTTHIDGHVGKVKPKHDPEESYSIRFLVNHKGKEKTYSIDPKLRVI